MNNEIDNLDVKFSENDNDGLKELIEPNMKELNDTFNKQIGNLKRYYQNVDNLILLHIETHKLIAPLKYELSPSVNEEFPHLFGKLNLDAVVKIENL